ncbi:MAG: ATPase, T2SS/T4P/T4SS family [Pseudobdellovibrionaceae bacterium]
MTNATQSLREIFEWALKEKASEVLVSSGLTPKARVGLEWIGRQGEAFSAHESKNLALSVLPERDRATLLEEGTATGSASIEGVGAVTYRILVHKTGVSSEFRFVSGKIPALVDLGYPHILQDLSKKTQGLILVSGPALSGKSTALWSMLQVAAFERSTTVSTFEKSIEYFISGSPSSVRQFDVSGGSQLNALFFEERASRVMAFDLGMNRQVIDTALSESESGKLVFLVLPGNSVKDVFGAVSALYSSVDREILFARLATQIQGGVGLRLSSYSNQIIPSFELLVGTPEVRAAIEKRAWNQVAEIMKTTGEKTGMRTLNQSLLQHLLRRKIEMRTAFELSPEPEELDRLLAKVGI